MKRGYVVPLVVSVAVLAAGGGLAWYVNRLLREAQVLPPRKTPAEIAQRDLEREAERRAAKLALGDRPPPAWSPAVGYWKRTTIDAFDAANPGKSWPGARRAVVLFGRDAAIDPANTGDETDGVLLGSEVAIEAGCDDPLVFCARGLHLYARKPFEAARPAVLAATAFLTDTRYPPVRRCFGLIYGARSRRQLPTPAPADDPPADKSRSRPATVPVEPPDAEAFVAAAVALFPDVLTDPELPAEELTRLVRRAHEVRDADGKPASEALIAAVERSSLPEVVKLTARGEYHIKAAWSARGTDTADRVTRGGWMGFAGHLQAARAALERAWALDNRNAEAATLMITVAMGLQLDRPTMETWYALAMSGRPGNAYAVTSKLLYLEPKWGGSPDAMLAFARELAADPNPAAVNLRPAVLDAYWALGDYVGEVNDHPVPSFFASDPTIFADVQAALEPYLAQVPDAHYHRTRYAAVAAWSGRMDVAKAQVDRLGTNFSRTTLTESEYNGLVDTRRLAPRR